MPKDATELAPLTAEELAALDATYRPIPSFSEWPPEAPRIELWQKRCNELERLRDELASPEVLRRAITTVQRTAAFETGAIEGLYPTDRGLTFSVATQSAAWESKVADRSEDALELFRAQLDAYEMVLDVATRNRPITEAWIRQIHEVLTEPQETYTVITPVGLQERELPRGQYKADPNHVRLDDGSTHSYAPVNQTAHEMARLIDAITTPDFATAHPILQSSYVHYCIAAIHPFSDGNGRVARAIASAYLYRAASVPLLVLADQRPQYFFALERADAGDAFPFVDFVGDAARSAIAMVTANLRAALAPDPHEGVMALRRLLLAQGDLTHQELDRIGSGLAGEIDQVFRENLDALQLPPGISAHSALGSGGAALIERSGFRGVPDTVAGSATASLVWLTVQSAPPADGNAQMQMKVLVSTQRDEAETFAISVGTNEVDEDLVFGLADVYPELTVAARFRLQAFAETIIGRALADLSEIAALSLSNAGYRNPLGAAMSGTNKARALSWLNERVGHLVTRVELESDAAGAERSVGLVQGRLSLEPGDERHVILVGVPPNLEPVDMWVDPDAIVTEESERLRIQLGNKAFLIEAND